MLRHRDYRLLWSGQIASGVGAQFQGIAISWHIYELTDSTVALGLVALFRVIPFMTLSLVGGAIADAVDRRRLLLVTQSLQTGVSLFLVASAVLRIEDPWPIYVAAFLGGAFAAFDGPARQALIPNLVPREELTNALTLNTLVRHTASIIAPGIAGVSVAALGIGPTFAVNAATHLAVVAALVAMHGVKMTPAPPASSNLQRIADGLDFARSEPLVLLPLVLDFITRTLGSPRGVLPVFARDIYAVGPVGLGWLSSANSVGGIAAGLVMGSAARVPRPVLVMLFAYFFEGIFNGAVGIAPSFMLAWVAFFAGGVCNVVAEVIFASVAQLRTPDYLRGRTTALTGMLALGGPSAGQFQIGLLASAIGPGRAVLFNGVASAGVTIVFALLPGLHARVGTKEMTDLVASSK